MNIHPVIVHFPVALLSLYAIFELLRFKKLNQFAWFYVKMSLLIVGTIGAYVALATGEAAEYIAHPVRALVEKHQFFAGASTFIFTVLGVIYIIKFIEMNWGVKISMSSWAGIWARLSRIVGHIYNSSFIVLLALLGLAAITITGALGGAMVYGTNSDPVMNFVYHLFF